MDFSPKGELRISGIENSRSFASAEAGIIYSVSSGLFQEEIIYFIHLSLLIFVKNCSYHPQLSPFFTLPSQPFIFQ